MRPACAFIDKENFSEIEQHLREGDIRTKIQTMKKIQNSGLSLEEIQQLLEPVVTDEDIRVQLYALRILFEHGDTDILEILFGYLSDPRTDRNVKLRVISLAESLHDEESMYRLTTLIEQENDVQVKIALIKAFLTVMPLDEVDKRIITIIQTYLAEGSPQIKMRILDLLSQHGASALPLIQNALDDHTILVMERAFEIMARINTAQVKNIVRSYVKKENAVIVYNAAFTLGILGEESSFRFITKDLQSDDRNLRMQALDFLFRKLGKGKDESFLRVIERMAEKDEDEEIRKKAEQYILFFNQINRSPSQQTAHKK